MGILINIKNKDAFPYCQTRINQGARQTIKLENGSKN